MEHVMADSVRQEDLQQITSDTLQSMNRYHEGLINNVLRAKYLIPKEGFVEQDVGKLGENLLWQLRRSQVSQISAALLAALPKKTLCRNSRLTSNVRRSRRCGRDSDGSLTNYWGFAG